MFDIMINIPRLLEDSDRAAKTDSKDVCRLLVKELVAVYDSLVFWKAELLFQVRDPAKQQKSQSEEEILMSSDLEISYSVLLHWAGLAKICVAVKKLQQ